MYHVVKKLIVLLNLSLLLMSLPVWLVNVNGDLVNTGTIAINPSKFVTIPLGVSGGLQEGNSSAYLLAAFGSSTFICLDAGTLLTGLQVAHANNSLDDIPLSTDTYATTASVVLRDHIKAYLISHAHLDHVAGLIFNSVEDLGKKPIMGLAATLQNLKKHLFNWQIWPNFSDTGVTPYLSRYYYVTMLPNERMPIPQTRLYVRAFPLSHGDAYESTAFLIESDGYYVLYLGDTGADAVEKSTHLQDVWKQVAPLVKKQVLRGIFLETSYPDGQPEEQLYGHLTPEWAIKSLQELANLVNPKNPQHALKDLPVIITHIKPSLRNDVDMRELIQSQLQNHNHLGVRFILAKQGQRIEF